MSVISPLRLVQGLHSSARAARKEAAFVHVRHENHDRRAASGRVGTIECEPKATMSCRINRLVVGEDPVILCISGRITAQDLDMLRDSLDQEKSAVAIDLKDVVLVDREAVKFLARCESKAVELRNCPAYVREWINREKTGARRRGKG